MCMSRGIAAFSACTSPRSTSPGTEPMHPARKVVPDRGDPKTKTTRSSSRPSPPRTDRRRTSTRPAARSWRIGVAVIASLC
jgi:hypothetical protein